MLVKHMNNIGYEIGRGIHLLSHSHAKAVAGIPHDRLLN